MNNWARNSVGRYAPMGATADDLPATPPSGKKTIDSTTEVDVAAYATAQVVDANLTAENIKKDVVILGTTGSYEGGGGGEASIEDIEVTNVLPNGKTLQNFDYDVSLEEDGVYLTCRSENSLSYPFVSGQPTYIQLIAGESTVGDYLRASNIAVTGDIEADGEYLTISGEGTVTINWVLG